MSFPGPSELEKTTIAAWYRYQQGDKTSVDDIYTSILPFCLRVCSKTCGKYINENDEEASIARLAMLEAFDKYDPQKGAILVFLGQVIRNRIIDYKRKETSKPGVLLYLADDRNKMEVQLAADTSAEEIVDDLARKQEIKALKEMLVKFSITFNDLVKSGPKHQKTREGVGKICWQIANDTELTNYIMEKRMLPAKELETRYKVSRKLLDRYRKYIIASVVIIIGDFSLLRPYVLPDQRGSSSGQK